MANLTITNIDNSGVFIERGEFEDDTFTVAGAGTTPAGTILARDSVSGFLVLFVKGGSTNENGIPKYVLSYDYVAAGAGNLPLRVAQTGKVRFSKLIIAADGDNSNVDKAVIDQLRDYGYVTLSVQELNSLDNQ